MRGKRWPGGDAKEDGRQDNRETGSVRSGGDAQEDGRQGGREEGGWGARVASLAGWQARWRQRVHVNSKVVRMQWQGSASEDQ